MHRKIDENVDLVLLHRTRGVGIRKPDRASPLVGMRLKTSGQGIRMQYIRVTVNFKVSMIVIGQDRQEKTPNRVQAKIPRHITDPQPAVWVTVPHNCRRRSRQAHATLVPLRMLLTNSPGIKIGMEMDRIEKVLRCR